MEKRETNQDLVGVVRLAAGGRKTQEEGVNVVGVSDASRFGAVNDGV